MWVAAARDVNDTILNETHFKIIYEHNNKNYNIKSVKMLLSFLYVFSWNILVT